MKKWLVFVGGIGHIGTVRSLPEWVPGSYWLARRKALKKYGKPGKRAVSERVEWSGRIISYCIYGDDDFFVH